MLGIFKFKELVIPGITELFSEPESPDFQLINTHFQGVNGVSQIRGARGGRMIIAQHVLVNDWRTRDDLRAFIAQLDLLKGQNGILEYSDTFEGNSAYPFPDTTFLGFRRLPPFEMQDPAGTLGIHMDHGGTVGEWYCRGLFEFHQLTVPTAP